MGDRTRAHSKKIPIYLNDEINECVLAISKEEDESTIVEYLECTNKGLQELVIPTQITVDDVTYNTTSIGAYLCKDWEDIESVVIQDGITNIGRKAFYNCKNLTSVILPDSLKKIGFETFSNCSKNLIFYANYNSYAYKWAEEKGYTVYSKESIPTSPTIKPEQPTITPEQPIVTPEQPVVTPQEPTVLPEPTPAPAVIGTILTDTANACTVKVTSADVTNPTVEYIGISDANAKKVSIPSQVTIEGITYTVTSIADNAFKGNKKMTQVTIPSTVVSVGKNAFKNCKKLTKVTADTGITEIKAGAFENCTKLKNVTVKSKELTTIGKNAFKGCKNLKTITIKSTKLTKKSIGKNALKGTNKKLTIKVPKKMEKTYKTYFKNKGNKTVKVKKA